MSRAALLTGRERLDAALAAAGVDASVVGQDLFSVVAVLAANPALRRALTDPARSADDKAGLAARLFAGKVGDIALDLTAGLVRSRWSTGGDLVDTVEALGVIAVLTSAADAGRVDAVEDELFRFSRIVAADTGLRDAFAGRTLGADRKAALVHRLLGGRVTPETEVLATRAGVSPRGLRTEHVLEAYVESAAQLRKQSVAQVVAAQPLTTPQRERLAAGLQRVYGRPIRLNVDIDPEVLGGLRVQVGSDVLDSTILRRLEDAKRRLAG